MKKILLFVLSSLTFLYAECYRDNNKEVVICKDKYKNYVGTLMWQDNKDAKTVTRDWNGAKKYCQGLTLGGYNDWRLPREKELLTITDMKRYSPAIKKSFKNVKSKEYWSSTIFASDWSTAYRVNFADGYCCVLFTHIYGYVRCVR